MNKFKIEMKKILTRDVIVEAKNEKEALDFIERVFQKSDLLDDYNEDFAQIDAKIIEKNDEIVENLEVLNKENIEEFLEKIPEGWKKVTCPECGKQIEIGEFIKDTVS